LPYRGEAPTLARQPKIGRTQPVDGVRPAT